MPSMRLPRQAATEDPELTKSVKSLRREELSALLNKQVSSGRLKAELITAVTGKAIPEGKRTIEDLEAAFRTMRRGDLDKIVLKLLGDGTLALHEASLDGTLALGRAEFLALRRGVARETPSVRRRTVELTLFTIT